MKTKIYSLMLACLLAALPVCAQTPPAHVNSAPRPSVTVTFTFRDAADNYTVFAGENSEGRYYLQVPANNVPAYKLANAAPGVKVMVDNDKSSEETMTFWVPVQPGTTPRVERKGNNVTLTFVPPATPGVLASTNTPTAPVISAEAAPPAAPAPQPAPNVAPLPLLPVAPLAAGVGTAIAENQPNTLADADLAVPESPAFTVLGLTPQTVVRPTSPRAFASAFLSGVDEHGNFQSGVALDTVPYLVFAGPQLTLRQYRHSYSTRLLARTQFSFGNTKGASDEDKSVRLAMGLRLTLWDKGDPHMDDELLNCFANDLKLPPPPTVIDPNNPGALSPADLAVRAGVSAQNVAAADKCREQARKRNWNRSSWIVALAPSWISPTGETKNFKWNGGGFWTSLAYGFEGIPSLEKNSQLIVHLRYRNNEQVADPNNAGKFLIQNSVFLGGRWRFGNENASANFEGVFQRIREKGKDWDSSARYSLGLERRIAENLWFSLSFGSQRGRQDGKNDGFVLSSFRWGFGQKRKFAIPGLAADASATP
jgi:hypothetical protein